MIEEKIDLNLSNVKCKINKEGRRMKIYIKLNKSETQGWTQVKKAFTGFNGSKADLVKMLFFRGVNAFMEDLKSQVDNMPEEEREKILKDAEAEVANSEGSEESAKGN